MPTVAVIVQARMGSSRLPGKVLREVGGATLLEHLVRRLRRSSAVSHIVIATTTAPADDAIVDEAARLGVGVFRGSEEDVLSRYAGAAGELEAEVIVRVTSDCPLLDPVELDRVVKAFEGAGVDYASNQAGSERRIPRGQDVEVMSRAALERAARESSDAGDREHVTPFLYRSPGRFRTLLTHRPGRDGSGFRITVDTPEDLEVVRAVVSALGPDASLDAIIDYLDRHPEVARLNQGVAQKDLTGDAERRQRRIAGRTLLAQAHAGPSVGFGHVARVGALLEAWVEAGGRAVLAGSGLEGGIIERLVRSGVELATDAAEPIAIAIDGYDFEPTHYASQRRRACTVVLDDFAERGLDADVVVHPNVGASAERYPSTSRVLVGAPYVLLRREIRQLVARPVERPHGVVVSFGGSDPTGLTLRLLEAGLPAGVPVDVLVGPAVSASVRPALLAFQSDFVRVHLDPPNVGALFHDKALAIAAAGSTVWELMALAVPTILVVVADNQRVVADGAVRLGGAIHAGDADAGAPTRIRELSAELLSQPERLARLRARGQGLIDGRGVWRVIDTVLDAVEERETGK